MNSEYPEVIFGQEARQKLFEGVEILAKAVSTTLGPKGQNVVVNKNGSYILTKDGVTVAKSVNLRDPYQQMGCQIVKQVAQRTNDVAGDGTTTATVLAHALLAGGMKLLAANHSSLEIKKGIEIAVKLIIEELKNVAIKVDSDEMIINVGTISANGEKDIGEILAAAMSKVGRDGVITVEEAKGLKTSLEIVDGTRFDRGYLSPYFITNSEKMNCELIDPLILISNLRFSAAADLLPLFELINQQHRSLLLIADEVDGEILQLLVTNHMRGTLKCCAIRAPAFGEHRLNMLNDIAVLTGGQLMTSGDKVNTHTKATELLKQNILGTCKRVVVDKSKVTLIGTAGNISAIKQRSDSLHEQSLDPTLDQEQKSMLQERLGKLASGVAIIHVGGSTEVELIERKYRVEDALNATQAAVEEGIVPGGGVALIKASHVISDVKSMNLSQGEELGVKLVYDACHAPFRKIVENAGGIIPVIERDIKDNKCITYGYNASTNEYADVLDVGIIDPVKVTRTAIENAASVAGLLLTVNSCVLATAEPENKLDARYDV